MRIFRTPRFLTHFFSGRTWGFSVSEPLVYLTFDDGPEPEITPWILDLLNEYNAKATFFCVGEQVRKYPELFAKLKSEGHSVGNHTMRHENGMSTNSKEYLKSIDEAAQLIQSHLFRPPYGRLSMRQSILIRRKNYRVVMWSWLSYDFDSTLSNELILSKAHQIRPGDILVFHDNLKCKERMKELLPQFLEQIQTRGYVCSAIV